MSRYAIGFSPEAQFIAKRTASGKQRLRDSNVFGLSTPLRTELGEVWSECQVANWDGNGAEPVSHEALHETYCFLESLPLGFPPPSVGAEPDGAMTLEWYFGRSRTLSISLAGDGELHYAALVGANATHGTELFDGVFPPTFVAILRRIAN